jgi:hypothetical protein
MCAFVFFDFGCLGVDFFERIRILALKNALLKK